MRIPTLRPPIPPRRFAGAESQRLRDPAVHRTYYGYRSAEPLAGIAENVEVSDGYRISNRGELVQYMIGLAGYRLLPHLLKNTIHVTTAMFNSLVQYVGEHPAYVLNDWETFAGLTEHGLTVDAQGAENAFRFIHLNGCHGPCHMGEDGSYRLSASIEEATKGASTRSTTILRS